MMGRRIGVEAGIASDPGDVVIRQSELSQDFVRVLAQGRWRSPGFLPGTAEREGKAERKRPAFRRMLSAAEKPDGFQIGIPYEVGRLLHGRIRYVGFVQPLSPVCRRSEEHTSELQSLMRISYAVFCLK